ncbi:MAG: methyltransferase domain-containing protein [Pseudomonadota bacterium]
MSTPNIFDKSFLNTKRTRAAKQITKYDFLLRHVAQDLSDRLSFILRTFTHTLDFGSHHGVVGHAVSKLETVDNVMFLDSCSALLQHCKGHKILADEEILPLAPKVFDLIVSGLSLQNLNDLPGILLQLRHTLKPDGLFLASLLGGRTLWELREAFNIAQEEMEGGTSPHIAPFVDVRDAGHLLQRAGFTLPVADTDSLTIHYDTALHLMKDLQGMGGSNSLIQRNRTPLKRSTLFRIVEIYQERFALKNGKDTGKVPATFEILTLTGWSPHDSQQQPLKPGSATTRLADALETTEHSAGEKAYFKDTP